MTVELRRVGPDAEHAIDGVTERLLVDGPVERVNCSEFAAPSIRWLLIAADHDDRNLLGFIGYAGPLEHCNSRSARNLAIEKNHLASCAERDHKCLRASTAKTSANFFGKDDASICG